MHIINKGRVTSNEGRGNPSSDSSPALCGTHIKPSPLVSRPSFLKVTGVTLIEMVIFIVIVGVAVTGITSVFINVSRSSAVPMVKMRSIELAQSMLEEILLKAYDDNTPNGGGCVRFPSGSSRCATGGAATAQAIASFGTDGTETRSNFDDVDDYHDLAYCGDNTTAADALCSGPCVSIIDDAESDISAEYAGYTVCIRLSFAGTEMNSVAPGTGTSVLAEDAKRIDVIVTDHLNGRVVLSAYRLNF